MSLLCKLGLHKWKQTGRTKIFSNSVETSWKIVQQCEKCGKFRRLMQKERKK